MKLHSPDFDEALLVEARQRLRQRPSQMEQVRYMERSWFRLRGGNWLYLMGVFWMCIPLRKYAGQEAVTVSSQVILSTWMLALSFFHAVRIGTFLYEDNDVGTLSQLPVRDHQIFRWQSQKALRHSLWFPLYAVIGLLVIQPVWGPWWLFPAAVAVIWSCNTAIGWLCYRFVGPVKAFYLGIAACLLIVISMVAPGRVAAETFIVQTGFLTLWLPTGWGVQMAGAAGQTNVGLIALIIGSGTFSLGYVASAAWRFLGESYSILPFDGATETPVQNQREPALENVNPLPVFLPAIDLKPAKGWETWYVNWLTKEEKEASTIAMTGELNWGKLWLASLKILLITGGLVLVSRHFFPQLLVLIAMAGLFQAAIKGLPWGVEFTAVFMDRQQGPLLTALHGVFPVNVRHLTRAMWKAATVRLIMALPLIWMAGCVLQLASRPAGAILDQLVPATLLAAKILLAGTALMPMMPILWFMRAGRFSKRRPGTFMAILAGVVLIAVGAFSAFGLSIFDGPLAGGFAILFACCSAFAAIFHYLYRSGKVDILRKAD